MNINSSKNRSMRKHYDLLDIPIRAGSYCHLLHRVLSSDRNKRCRFCPLHTDSGTCRYWVWRGDSPKLNWFPMFLEDRDSRLINFETALQYMFTKAEEYKTRHLGSDGPRRSALLALHHSFLIQQCIDTTKDPYVQKCFREDEDLKCELMCVPLLEAINKFMEGKDRPGDLAGIFHEQLGYYADDWAYRKKDKAPRYLEMKIIALAEVTMLLEEYCAGTDVKRWIDPCHMHLVLNACQKHLTDNTVYASASALLDKYEGGMK